MQETVTPVQRTARGTGSGMEKLVSLFLLASRSTDVGGHMPP